MDQYSVRQQPVPKSQVGQTYTEVATSPAVSGPPMTPGEHREQWGVDWRSPALMAICLASGIAFAFGHHFYYQSLSNTAVVSSSQQTWAVRIGTGLAFLVKTALGGTTAVVFTQLIWVTLRRKMISISAIDSIFALTTDLGAFFNSDLLINAKTVTVLGVLIWCLPLIATITPATLTIGLHPVQYFDLRAVPYINSSWGNITSSGNPMAILGGGSAITTAFTEPSPLVVRLVTASATTLSNLPFDPPSVNSSYHFEMYGPALSCQNATEAQRSYLRNLTASSFSVVYHGVQLPSPERNSTQSSTVNSFLIYMLSGTTNLACEYFNASYDILFEFSNGVQTTTVTNRTLLNNIIDIIPLDIALDSTVCAQYQSPDPLNTTCAQTTPAVSLLSYTAIIQVFQQIFQGVIYVGSLGNVFVNSTTVLSTGLVGCFEFSEYQHTTNISFACRNGNAALTMEEIMTNFTLSMLSSPDIVAQSEIYKANVSINTFANYYVYDSRNLILTYAIAVFITVLFAALGTWAFCSNGISSSASFSSILLTTRNQDLDNLARGSTLGSQPLDRTISRTKLRFGVLDGDYLHGGEGGRVGFGIEGAVRELGKGEMVT